MKRILTGIQPTGVITLGNYIGAIKQMVKNQGENESFIFVADLHSITIPKDPKELRDNIRNLLGVYLACGIDPKKNTIYLQSEIEYIPCISWLLECSTYYGELSRMTQFKDKSSKNQNFTAGILTYPILMTADIVGVDADIVPVGIDQKQHVELARDIAIRFNKKFGDTFKIPEPMITKTGTKITDLQDPLKKMSKSAENQKGVIRLLDEESIIRKKIMSATTDSEMEVRFDPEKKAGISNLMNIYSSLTGMSMSEIEEKFAGCNYGTFKKEVADVVVNELVGIQKRYNEIINSSIMDEVLEEGRVKVLEITKKKYLVLKDKMGLKR